MKTKEREERKMGYTRYWNRTAKAMDEGFVEFCNEVFKTCTKLGIKIGNSCGFGEPTVNTKLVAFNGDASKDLDHESCILDDEEGFNFCKTARKPYDYAVRTILREALTRGYITDLSDDGINEEIISDKEYY
jgi:hypothetical protein